ncbi:MAG: hypothetical protein J6O51_07555 [Bacteroidales bacterium]|nr:hypothetical protein [Bacteroidales bacterium]
MKKLVVYLAAFAALVAVASACNHNQTPKEEPDVPEDVVKAAVNLTEDGTANAYIVKPGSTVAFSVAYKGNSKTEEVGAAEAVKLMWQTDKDLVKEVFLDRKGKVAYAVTGQKEGNAVVAVSDASGNVLWSWHLWVSDYDPAASLYKVKDSDWELMDRNLGALSNKPEDNFKAFGLIYQWGRKDPFTAAARYVVQNEDFSYQDDGEAPIYDIEGKELPSFLSTAATDGSVQKSIANPAIFYKVYQVKTGKVDEYGEEIKEDVPRTRDWADVSNDDAWGGVSGVKTIYDPCPKGYKVPVATADGKTPYYWCSHAGSVWNNGRIDDGLYLPAAGTRVNYSGGLNISEAIPYGGIWIGTAGKASDNLDLYPTLYGQYMGIFSGKRTYKMGKDSRSQGLSVRCCKE